MRALLVLACLLVCLASSVQAACLPPYIACNVTSNTPVVCALFEDQCTKCPTASPDTVWWVCPVDEKCVTNYTSCTLLPFMDPKLPIEHRVRDVVSRLTVVEKIDQLMYGTPAVRRLSIPSYSWLNEALHGVARAGLATSFPQVSALGSTFDEGLFFRIGQVIGVEGRAKHNQDVLNNSRGDYQGVSFYAPNINIYRDPRWGRGQEVTGEDPFHNGRYAVNLVRGMQQQNSTKGGNTTYYEVLSCCKHLVAYSLDNDTRANTTRYAFDAVVSAFDMESTYTPAFKACVREGKVSSIMCSYNSVNGVPTCADPRLLNGLLRQQWGFDGFVISDYDAVYNAYDPHFYANSPVEAAAICLKAGCDQDGGSTYQHLTEAYALGMINDTDLDVATSRMFYNRIKLGLLDPPSMVFNAVPPSDNDTPAHRALAREAANKAVVLLKNSQRVLPLDRNAFRAAKIALIGPNANAKETLLGNYQGTPKHIVSIEEGIRNQVGPNATITVDLACDIWCSSNADFPNAVALAKASDLVIAVVGLNLTIEQESQDRVNIALPGYQEALIQTLQSSIDSSKTRFLVLIITGGSLAISWTASNVDTIVVGWYSGEEGGNGIADVLFGNVSPAGRLSQTWYRSNDDLPPYTDMSMTSMLGRTYRYFTGAPVYPFGYGLSYTNFTYSELRLNATSINPCDTIQVAVTVKNTGAVASDEVVQLYVYLPQSGAIGWQLQGYRRVHLLQPNTTADVEFVLRPEQMTYVDSKGQRSLQPATVLVSVGGGQPRYTMTSVAKFTVQGPATPISQCKN